MLPARGVTRTAAAGTGRSGAARLVGSAAGRPRSRAAVRVQCAASQFSASSNGSTPPPIGLGGEGTQLMVKARGVGGTATGGGYFWLETLFAMRGRAWPATPLAVFTGYCAAVVALAQAHPELIEPHRSSFATIQAANNTIGIALFFLQGFTANQAYASWKEGRVLWDAVATNCQNISLLLAANGVTSQPLAQAIFRWMWMFNVTLKHAQRVEEVTPGEWEEVGMPPEDAAALRATDIEERPLLCATRLMQLSRTCVDQDAFASGIADFDRIRGPIEALAAQVQNMNRVMNTPLPFAYLVHLRSFMVIWLGALPLIYNPIDMGWATLPVCFLIGYAILGIDAISVQVEAPMGRDFSDLPVDMIVIDINRRARAMCGEAVFRDAGPQHQQSSRTLASAASNN